MNSIGCWLMRVVNHPSIITTMMVPFMFLFIEAEIYHAHIPSSLLHMHKKTGVRVTNMKSFVVVKFFIRPFQMYTTLTSTRYVQAMSTLDDLLRGGKSSHQTNLFTFKISPKRHF